MFKIIGGDGKEYGPVTMDQIRDWMAAGRANLDSQVRGVDQTTFRRLGDLPEFSGGVPPTLSAAPAGAKLAGRGARFGAACLDFALIMVCSIPSAVAQFHYFNEHGFPRPGQFDPAVLQALPGVQLSRNAIWALLALQVLMLGLRAQTFGKLAARIQIVRASTGAQAGFVNAALLRLVLPMAFYTLMGRVIPIPLISAFLFLVILMTDICFIFRDDRRCIHDLIAGTRVDKIG